MRRGRKVAAVALGITVVTALVFLTGSTTMAARYEEPPYTVGRTYDRFEVRTYGPTIEAQVTVAGSYSQAVSSAFRVLAGYIFGGNAPRAAIAMTTPVSAQPAGARIDMTTPVSAAPDAGGWTVSFTMPSTWTMDTLPRANDARVKLVEMPGGTWVVRTFRGRLTDAVAARELADLRRDAEAASLRLTDRQIVSQFNPPWVLGPWRRNEVRWLLAPAPEPGSATGAR